VRRLLVGGAPVLLVVVSLLVAGCGSGGAATGDRAASETRLTPQANAAIPRTAKQPRTESPGQGGGNGGQKVTKAVAPSTGVAAPSGSTPAGTGRTCQMTLGGQTASVPCRLRPMLADAYRRNPALARFLAAAAGRP
jgi:hypothetical protein